MPPFRPSLHPAYAGAGLPASQPRVQTPGPLAPALARVAQGLGAGLAGAGLAGTGILGAGRAPGTNLIPQTRWPHPRPTTPQPEAGEEAHAYATPAPQAQPTAQPTAYPHAAPPAPPIWPTTTPATSGPIAAPPPRPHGTTPASARRSPRRQHPLAALLTLRPGALLAKLPQLLHTPSRASLRVMAPRALALIAACLLAYGLLSPTPLNWSLPADATEASPSGLTVEPMPFEKPGESFPGSAFYYLAPEPARQADTSSLAPDAHWDGDSNSLSIGPSARPLAQVATQTDRMRALNCLTTAIYYEAATEPDAGQKAVAQVILNRMAHPAFPKTVCGVVYQGSERATGCQFTFTCDGSMARHPMAMFWNRAEMVARAALAGYVYTPVGLATHYHTFQVHPYWDAGVNFIGQIGAHRFYRMQGPAGAPEAFLAAYRGGEPTPGPHPRSSVVSARPDVAADPLVLQRAFAAGKVTVTQGFTPAVYTTHAPGALPPPAYTSEVLRRGGDAAYRASNLPGSHPDAQNVKPEYQNSGRWLGDPQ